VIVQDNRIAPTPKILRSIEADMLQKVDGSEIVWSGRAATALYWAYRVAVSVNNAAEQPEVILPAISCATPANAALLAGLTPRFADIDPQTGLISLASVQARYSPNTRAVVFIHLYGQTADLQPLVMWCQKKNILLIEDAAQALGAHLPDGRPVGAIGHMSVYSFNKTKILECGGGALLLRPKGLKQALESELHNNPLEPEPHTETSALLELSYRNLHHALVTLFRLRAADGIADLFLRIRGAYEGLYLRSLKNPDLLARAWQQLPALLEQRHQKAEIYAERLAGGPWQLLNGWRDSRVCWRFSLLVNFPDRLVPFSESIRSDGFHVSNLYWPVNQFFSPNDVCPKADTFARRIVNLWADNSVDVNWIEQCSDSLMRHAVQFIA
jgi:dTDP-4-amino-4,6-dideoxygalactose transaminase